jgi:hypothetical protein
MEYAAVLEWLNGTRSPSGATVDYFFEKSNSEAEGL